MTDSKKIMLARLRVAVCRARQTVADIEEVGVLLAADRISAAGALHLMWENDVLDLCLTTAEIEGAVADKKAAA